MRRRMVLASAVMLAVAGLLYSGAALAQGTPSEEELVERIQKGGTAQDHEALAALYRAEADAADKQATDHESMAKRYASLGGKGDWATHCRNLTSYYRKAAAEYRTLAEMHTKEAAQGGK